MRENRVICLLLCLVTVLSLLGGCGKAPVATQPETTAPETTEAPTQATEAPTQGTEPAVVFAPLQLDTRRRSR